MTGKQRREEILQLLQQNKEYQNATHIAGQFGVSRQIIVSDIAILRAQGHAIVSTPRGYLLDSAMPEGVINTIACSHTKAQIRDEFYTIVDQGGSVLDVSVDHPVYGQLSATLNIRSRYDSDLFIEKMEQQSGKPLSALTDGLHLHRIATRTQEDFERICEALAKLHILCDE